jgi:hypothetical protein
LSPISKSPQDLSSAKERRGVLGTGEQPVGSAPIKGQRLARKRGEKRKKQKTAEKEGG